MGDLSDFIVERNENLLGRSNVYDTCHGMCTSEN